MTEEELIIKGTKWLSDNLEVRDLEVDKTDGLAVRYVAGQNRVVRRVLTFIERSPQNLQWLHDWLTENGKSLEQDVFNLFWEIWSRTYKIKHPQVISETITVKGDVDWTLIALKELNNE